MASTALAVLAVAIIVIIGIGAFAVFQQTAQTTETKGRALFAVTDDHNLEDIQNVFVTVESVKVRSGSEGWITVSSSPQTVDLIRLRTNGESAVIADAELFSDTYTQVQLDISNVIVIDEDNAAHRVITPTNQLVFNNQLIVRSNETATVVLDINLDDSLRTAVSGTNVTQFVFMPVIIIQVQEGAVVNIGDTQTVNINVGNITNINNVNIPARVVHIPVRNIQGTVVSNTTVGMNQNGTIVQGQPIPRNAIITIVNNRIVVNVNNTVIIGNQTGNQTACPADAFMCPDGTFVGRTGPNCQFICPGNQTNQTGNQTGNQTIGNQTNQTFFFLTANLLGMNEVPPVNNTNATGMVNATINGSSLTLSGSFANLSSDLYSTGGSSAHIHFAPSNASGSIIFPINVAPGFDNQQGTLSFQTMLSDSQIAAFRNGSMYVNVHTVNYPAGEIRGQLTVQ